MVRTLPRAASLTRAMSLARRSALMKAVTGTASLVSLSIIRAMEIPQLGWQPQESWPQSRSGPVDEVGPVGEGGHEGDGEPVAGGLAEAGLVFDVVREVREGVALGHAALVGDFFVAASERDGLEGEEVDLLGLSRANSMMRPTCSLLMPLMMQVTGTMSTPASWRLWMAWSLTSNALPDLAVGVGRVADAVELEVGVAEAGLGGGFGELLGFGELDAVGGCLDGGVADLAGVGDGVEEVRGEGGLAAGELDGHLTPGLDGDGVVEHGLDLVPGELVDEADLVGVHEAGVAHHVAAVGEVDGEDGAAAMGDGAGSMIVQGLVVVGADVAAGEDLFEVLEEGGVDGHDVLRSGRGWGSP